MLASLVVRWHLEAVAVAVVAGAAVAVGGRAARLPSHVVATIATVVGLALLAVDGRSPWSLVVALAAVAGSRALPRSRTGDVGRIVADGCGVAAVLVATDAPAGATAVLVLAAVVVVAGGRALDDRLPPLTAPAVAAVGAAGVWACAPDTEAAATLGAVMAVPVVVALVLGRPPGEPALVRAGPSPWVVSALAVVWAAGDGLASRPAASGLVLVAAATLAGPALAAARLPSSRSVAAAIVGSGMVLAVAARTIGLGDGPEPSAPLAVLMAAGAALPWVAIGLRPTDPGNATGDD